eukprot:jgi/Chlat1/2965/Chrsp2S04694
MDRRRISSRLSSSSSPASVSGGDGRMRAPSGYGVSSGDHDASSMDGDTAACLEAADAAVALLGPAYVELCRAAAVLERACADYAACLKYLKRRFSPKETALTATVPTARPVRSTAQAAGIQNIGRTTGRRMSGANPRTASSPFASSSEPTASTTEATTALNDSGPSVGPPVLPERFAALLRKHFDANGGKGSASTSPLTTHSNAAAAAVAAQRQFLDRLSDRKPSATTQTRKGSRRARASTWGGSDVQSQPSQQQLLQAQAPHVQHWARHVAALSAARHVQAALRAVDWESIRPGTPREAVFATAEMLKDTMRLWQWVVLEHQSLQAGSSAMRHRNRALRALLLQSKAQFEGSSLVLSHTGRQRSSSVVHRTVSTSSPSSSWLYARGQSTKAASNDKSDDGEASNEAASTPVHEGPVDAWLPAMQWAQAGEGAKELILALSNTHAEACSWVPTYTNQLLSIVALRHNIQLHALSSAVEATIGTRLIPPTQGCNDGQQHHQM